MAMDMGKAFARTHIQVAETQTGLAPLRFDYSRIEDVEGRTVAQQAAQEVRTLLNHTATILQRSKENVWRMGGELTLAKERLAHTEFEDWVRDEFGPEQFGDYAISQRTAQRWMQLHREMTLDALLASNISLSGFLALTAKSTPEGVRVEALAREAAGEKVTQATIKELKARPVVIVEPEPEMVEDAPEEVDSYEMWRTAHTASIALLTRQVENYRRDALAMGGAVGGYDGAIQALEVQRRLLEG